MITKKNSPEIYLISPNKIVKTEFLEILNNILSFGLVQIFQLRIKNCELGYLNELIKAIKPLKTRALGPRGTHFFWGGPGAPKNFGGAKGPLFLKVFIAFYRF